LLKHIRDVRGWDRSRRDTLKRIPKNGTVGSTGLINDNDSDEQFEVCRRKNIERLEARLALLRYREQVRRRELEVTGSALEDKFRDLLGLIRRGVSYPYYGDWLETQFSEAQRRIIYALLEGIIEQSPWQGVRGVW
jgi:hypothetical protein